MTTRIAALIAAIALAACSASTTAPAVKHMSVNGASLAYVDEGAGAPVVFVHGRLGDYRVWEADRAPIAAHHRFIALAQRYFGTEPWPDKGENFSTTTHIADLAAFVQGLNAGPVTLVGWSYSGRIVLQVARDHPELVKSIFIYEPADGDGITDAAELETFSNDWKAMLAPPPGAPPTDAELARLLIDGVDETPGSFDSFSPALRDVLLDDARTLSLGASATPVPPLSCEQLKDIKAQTTIVRGELSRPLFKLSSDAAARCIANARHIVVPGQRHLWPAQQPAAFTKMLLEFLDGQ